MHTLISPTKEILLSLITGDNYVELTDYYGRTLANTYINACKDIGIETTDATHNNIYMTFYNAAKLAGYCTICIDSIDQIQASQKPKKAIAVIRQEMFELIVDVTSRAASYANLVSILTVDIDDHFCAKNLRFDFNQENNISHYNFGEDPFFLLLYLYKYCNTCINNFVYYCDHIESMSNLMIHNKYFELIGSNVELCGFAIKHNISLILLEKEIRANKKSKS